MLILRKVLRIMRIISQYIRITCLCSGSVYSLIPHTPLIYSKTGVYRGISIFLIFDPKHRFWVLVRTNSPRRGGSNLYPQSVLNKNKIKYQNFSSKKFPFLQFKKNLYIIWACFRHVIFSSSTDICCWYLSGVLVKYYLSRSMIEHSCCINLYKLLKYLVLVPLVRNNGIILLKNGGTVKAGFPIKEYIHK